MRAKGSGGRELGQFLAAIRYERGLTQGEVAGIIGTRQSVIGGIELGASLSIHRAAELADALSMDTRQRVKLIELMGFPLTPGGK